MATLFNGCDRGRVGEVVPLRRGILGLRSRCGTLSSRTLHTGASRFGREVRTKRDLSDVLPRTFTTYERTNSHILNVHRFPIRVVNNVVLRRNEVTRVGANRNGALITALPTCLGTLANGNIRVIAMGSCLTGHSDR